MFADIQSNLIFVVTNFFGKWRWNFVFPRDHRGYRTFLMATLKSPKESNVMSFTFDCKFDESPNVDKNQLFLCFVKENNNFGLLEATYFSESGANSLHSGSRNLLFLV